MRVRTLLAATALVSAALGAVAVYLVLTVPNDTKAAALLRTAKQQMAAGDNAQARQTLSRIVQQYPRTDAAASATVALVTLADNEQRKLMSEIETLRKEQDSLKRQVTTQGNRVQTIENRPVPAPVIIQQPVPQPVPAPAPAKKKAPSSTKKKRH